MNAGEIIAIAVIACIIGGAVVYIVKARKSGKKCIGCPDSGTCNAKGKGQCGSCNGQCNSCRQHEENQ